MALVHDMSESLVGDITPFDNITPQQKYDLEHSAMVDLKTTLGDQLGQEFYDLWKEYADAKTPEAKLVKQLDKLEMILQAEQYENAQNIDLSHFFQSTKSSFHHEEVASLAAELNNRRQITKNDT